jgi:hypothetical protein
MIGEFTVICVLFGGAPDLRVKVRTALAFTALATPICIVLAVVSAGVAFQHSLVTPGWFIAIKLVPLPAVTNNWGGGGPRFLVALGLDSLCYFAVILALFVVVRRFRSSKK